MSSYFRVKGLECSSCERYLKHRADTIESIREFEVNVGTGLARVKHDRSRTGSEVGEILSGHGYRFRPAREALEPEQESVPATLVVSLFFGMMVMVWYVLFLYPLDLGVPLEDGLLNLDGPAGHFLIGNLAVMSGVVLTLGARDLWRSALVSIRMGQLNANVLILFAATNAYVYSLILWGLGNERLYFDIPAFLIGVILLGRWLVDRARATVLNQLTEQLGDRPEAQRIDQDGSIQSVQPDELEPGDRVMVYPGSPFPADGCVLEGRSPVDRSMVTGESMPEVRGPGDDVQAGCIPLDQRLIVNVTESRGARRRLLEKTWALQSRSSGIQRTVDRLTGWVVPLVLMAALMTVVGHLAGGYGAEPTLLRTMAVILVTCPCALGLATPLTMAAGLRGALRQDVLIRSGSVLERPAQFDTTAVDKTGTLTRPGMTVRAVHGGELPAWVAGLQQHSNHPVARALRDHSSGTPEQVQAVEPLPEGGLKGEFEGQTVLVGPPSSLRNQSLEWPEDLVKPADIRRPTRRVILAVDGRVSHLVELEEPTREGADELLHDLASSSDRLVVTTGDDGPTNRRWEQHPAVDTVLGGLTPTEKQACVNAWSAEGPVRYLGDGTNDSLALARADFGVALAEGTDLAGYSADVVVAGESLQAVQQALGLLANIRQRLYQNLGWGLLYNLIAIPAAILGYLSPLVAGLAMITSSLVVVTNARRSYAESLGC